MKGWKDMENRKWGYEMINRGELGNRGRLGGGGSGLGGGGVGCCGGGGLCRNLASFSGVPWDQMGRSESMPTCRRTWLVMDPSPNQR